MIQNIKKKFILPLFAIVGLCSFVGQTTLPFHEPLPRVIPKGDFFSEEEKISISIKSLTAEESKKYLKADLLKSGYVPLSVSIENQSSDDYLIRPELISLPLVESSKIASVIKRSSLPASIGLKIAGFIFWPFSIPSTMHGIKTLQDHQKMKRDLSIKSVKEELIPPYTTMNRVFFVPSEKSQESFSVSLINQETLESKVFWVEQVGEEMANLLEPIPLPQENYYLTHDA